MLLRRMVAVPMRIRGTIIGSSNLTNLRYSSSTAPTNNSKLILRSNKNDVTTLVMNNTSRLNGWTEPMMEVRRVVQLRLLLLQFVLAMLVVDVNSIIDADSRVWIISMADCSISIITFGAPLIALSEGAVWSIGCSRCRPKNKSGSTHRS